MGRRPVRSAAAQSFLGTVRVKGGGVRVFYIYGLPDRFGGSVVVGDSGEGSRGEGRLG